MRCNEGIGEVCQSGLRLDHVGILFGCAASLFDERAVTAVSGAYAFKRGNGRFDVGHNRIVGRHILSLPSLLNCAENRDVAFLILKFFDEYIGDVRRHMQYENKHVFTYVRSLLGGTRPQGFEIARFEKSHLGVDKKLQELKNIIIKYYTSPTTPEHLNMVLFDIFECEADLRTHCRLEDDLFVPAVKILELSAEQAADKDSASNAETNPENRLSERECDIVRCVVRGMANKEIAAQLFISLNTVLTHRKNISRKLNIHSVAGLTIYAIAAGLVSLEEVGIK